MKSKLILITIILISLLIITACQLQPGKSIVGKAIDNSCNFDQDCPRGETCSRGICSGSIQDDSTPIEEEYGYGGNPTVCGNGQVEEGEECDDGNTINHDQCNNNCLQAICFDSDPISDPTHLGAVVVVYGDQLGWKMQYDNCPSNTDAKVWEVSCSNDAKVTTQTLLNCPLNSQCSKGACLGSDTNCGDLAQYPDMFVKYGGMNDKGEDYFTFDGYMVVGEKAPAIDNLAITDIATNMKYQNKAVSAVADAAKLDTEITDPSAQHLIIVGSPCTFTNQKILKLYDADKSNCVEKTGVDTNQPLGRGTIKLLKQQTGKYNLLINGYSGTERLLAAQIIAYRANELQWDEVHVDGQTKIPENPSFWDWKTATISKKVSQDKNCV